MAIQALRLVPDPHTGLPMTLPLELYNFRAVVLDPIGTIAIVLGGVPLIRWLASKAPGRYVLDGLKTLKFFALTTDQRLWAVVIAAVASFFIASGFQTDYANWAGQTCYLAIKGSTCLHPEWIAIGAGLFGLAAYLWLLERKD
jgi:hypothetical protein